MSRPVSTESVFRAIAHPSRRRLLELISRREWAACDLADQFHHAQPTTSNHLRILHQAGLIQFERRGRTLMYRLCPGALGAVAQWLARFPTSVTKASQKG